MSTILYLATSDGVSTWEQRGETFTHRDNGLQDHYVTCISAGRESLLAGSEDGIYRSDNGGESWQESSRGLSLPHVRWISHKPTYPQTVLAGTEPAGIFISRDGGRNWIERGEVGPFRDDGGWYLPYSPEAGCIRDFTFHGDRVYAAVEVGGMLTSDDGGTNWDLVEGCTGTPDMPPPPGLVHPDVHSIIVHPSSPDLVFACCGGGLYRSDDAGTQWDELYPCYCRAAWINPSNPEHIILGPADDVSHNGRIEVSRDGGRSWEPVSGGLSTPWPDRMIERFLPVNGILLGILSDGDTLCCTADYQQWHHVIQEKTDVHDATYFNG